MATVYIFEVEHKGERSAGVRAYDDTVKVEVRSGDPGGVPGEFEAHVKTCLQEWFDGASVVHTDTVEDA